MWVAGVFFAVVLTIAGINDFAIERKPYETAGCCQKSHSTPYTRPERSKTGNQKRHTAKKEPVKASGKSKKAHSQGISLDKLSRLCRAKVSFKI